MVDKRLGLVGLIGGISLGIVLWSSPPAWRPIYDFMDGLLGISSDSAKDESGEVEISAARAKNNLISPLNEEEIKEYIQGFVYFSGNQFESSVPIIGKYALLGDKDAQTAIGLLYYFGKGLPVNRQESIRWFRLSAAQGNATDKAILALAEQGNLRWPEPSSAAMLAANPLPPESSESIPEVQYPSTLPTVEKSEAFRASEAISAEQLRRSLEMAQADANRPISKNYARRTPMAPLYGEGEAEVGQAAGVNSVPAIVNPPGPVILNRAAGGYVDQRGDFYTQAGPHGVVNTRTGEFSPTN